MYIVQMTSTPFSEGNVLGAAPIVEIVSRIYIPRRGKGVIAPVQL